MHWLMFSGRTGYDTAQRHKGAKAQRLAGPEFHLKLFYR